MPKWKKSSNIDAALSAERGQALHHQWSGKTLFG